MEIKVQIHSIEDLDHAIRRAILGVAKRRRKTSNPLIYMSLSEFLISQLRKKLSIVNGDFLILSFDVEKNALTNIDAVVYTRKSDVSLRKIELTKDALEKLVTIEVA